MKVENHINKKYRLTRWPFFNLMEIIAVFGDDGREELNNLKKEGKIRRRRGANAPLVQLLVTDDGEVIKEP